MKLECAIVVLGFSLSLCANANSQRYGGSVTIETHYELGKTERDKLKLGIDRCLFGDITCFEDYRGKVFLRPEYPRKMLRNKKQAVCIADVRINIDGDVEKIREVVCSPKRSFVKSVKNAVKTFQFHPRVIKGNAVEVNQALLKINYKIVPMK